MFKRFLKVVVASVVSLQSVAVAQVPTAIPTVLPNDASKLQNWYHQIGATQAWKITTGNRKPIVAILSTGVDITHPDLSSNIFVNGHEIPNNGVDEDRNGFIDDVKGVNVVNNSGDVQDSFGGGTYVAGLIGARGNNKIGIPGVNWAVRMMPVKIVDDKGYTTINTVVRGIRYVIAMKKKGHNIKVMYISSLNAPGVFDNYRDALIDAAAAGIVTVTSAGSKPIDNDSSAEVPLPARFKLPSVVSVGSVDNGSLITEFSPIGTSTVHLFAPSMQILSTIPGGKVDVFTTHLAPAGFVAGAMALLSSVEPDLSPAEAIERLLASGTPKIDLEGASMSGRVLNLNNLHLKTVWASSPSSDTVHRLHVVRPGKGYKVHAT